MKSEGSAMKSEGSADRAVHVQTARRLKTLHVHRSTKKYFRNVRRFSRNIFTRFILSSQKPRKMGGLLYIIGLSLAPREKSTLCNRQGMDGKSSVGLSNTLPAQFLLQAKICPDCKDVWVLNREFGVVFRILRYPARPAFWHWGIWRSQAIRTKNGGCHFSLKI